VTLRSALTTSRPPSRPPTPIAVRAGGRVSQSSQALCGPVLASKGGSNLASAEGSARRVFWVTDNGSAHRGAKGDARLQQRWTNLLPVHTPRHASWLNQIEIYFSIVQRKVLTPNDFSCLQEVEDRLLSFQEYYERMATPFDWKFTREDLAKLVRKLGASSPLPLAA